MKTKMKQIGLRVETPVYEDFKHTLELLEVDEADLARRAFKAGIKIAVAELTEEKRKQAQALLDRLVQNQNTYA